MLCKGLFASTVRIMADGAVVSMGMAVLRRATGIALIQPQRIERPAVRRAAQIFVDVGEFLCDKAVELAGKLEQQKKPHWVNSD